MTELRYEDGKVSGALVHSEEGEIISIKSRIVVNATGPFSDKIRAMDNETQPIMTTSRGTHVILDESYCPSNTGLLSPNTQD